MTSSKIYYNGLDWIRAIAAVLVVSWHVGGTNIPAINNNLILLAVPLFIFISCFLLANKKEPFSYFNKKIWRLLLLYFFWTGLLTLFYGGTTGLKTMITNSDSILNTILHGGNTPYWFFMSLVICTFLAYIASKLNKWTNIILLTFFCGIVVVSPILTIHYGLTFFSLFYNPLNFTAYPFAAFLLAHYLKKQPNPLPIIITTFSLGVIFAIGEAHFLNGYPWAINNSNLPDYTRLSLLFFSFTTVTTCLEYLKKTPQLIKIMSDYSLGLYCLHPFFLSFFIDRTPPVLSLILVVPLCYLSTWFLKKFVLKTGLI